MRNIITIILFMSLIITGCIPQKIETINYDVIVIGTDPEGIAAALAASRAGANTLLIDSRSKIGGLFTLGWLNFLDMNFSKSGELLTKGIFQEFYNQIEGIAFDINTAQTVFENMINDEDNLVLQLNAMNIDPIIKDNTILGVSTTIDNKKQIFKASTVIDATQDGDIAALAGAPFTLGQEDIGGPSHGMAVTQVFKLGGIKEDDWRRLRQYLRNDNDINSSSTHNTAWGFARFYQDYKPSQENVQLRGLNIARQKDGCVMINALQVFQVDPLDEQSRQLAKEKALVELEHIIPFINREVPGMENAKLLSVAPELYIRESRHLQAEYRLTIDDVLENRNFWDKIALGSYPVDMQGTAAGDDVIIIGNPSQYSIPLRSIIPLEIENLLVVGRAAGYDSLAHGSARMVPVGMCTAEAAGNVAVIAQENSVTVRELAKNKKLVQQLQDKLITNGAYLPEFNITPKIASSPYYDGVKLLRKYGLIQGRYDNNYRLNEVVTKEEYYNNLTSLAAILKWNYTPKNLVSNTERLSKTDIELSLDKPDLINYLKATDIWDNIQNYNSLTRGEMSLIIYEIKNYITTN